MDNFNVFDFGDIFKMWDSVFENEFKPLCSSSLPPYNEYLDEVGNIHFDVALAGYKKENISITPNENGILIDIEAVPTTISDVKVEKVIHAGLKKSKMNMRIFTPVTRYDVNNALVHFKDGILSIEIKLLEEKRAKKIDIL